MRRSGFRLETVLRLRERELAGAEAALAARLRAQQRDADERDRWLALLDAGARALASRINAGISAGAAQLADFAIDASRLRANTAEQHRLAHDAPIERTRDELVQAHRRVRALEKLKERFVRDERGRRARIAARDLDEIGIRIAERKRR